MNKNTPLKYFFLLSVFFIIVLVLLFTQTQNNLSKKLTTSTFAAPVCDPPCQTEPPCCAEIINRYKALGGKPEDLEGLDDGEQPYHACPGLYDGQNERGYCRSQVCDQLPQGVKYRGRCGWYWGYHEGATNSPDGYGCMIGEAGSMKPICGGGIGPTNIPPPNSTPPPNTTPPPSQGAGKVQIRIHKDSASGSLWDGSKSIEVYLEGPTQGGRRFGELLKIYGTAKSSCKSQGGFPYDCGSGKALWSGADGRSGTATGQYTVQITKTPQGVTTKEGSKNGDLSANSTLVFDLVVSGSSGDESEPTATPNPNQTAAPSPTRTPRTTKTPTPTPRNNSNDSSRLFDRIKSIFIPEISPISNSLPGSPPQINPPEVVINTIQEINIQTGQGLTAIGSLFQEIRRLDGNLENGINEMIGGLFR